MKTHFIHATLELGDINFPTDDLPQRIGIVTTIQYLKDMDKIKDYLESKNKSAIIAGQILGCDQTPALQKTDQVDAFLYVGTGEFHPLGIAIATDKPVWKLHPQGMTLTKINPEDVNKIKKRKQGMLAKFYSSKTIGILETTKKGQSRAQTTKEEINKLKDKFPDKEFYFFTSDTLNFSELENFPFIECWINTMCPRIMEDIKVLNINDLN